MNPDTDVTYQTVNLFSSEKIFIYLFLMFHITFDEICTTMYISGKGRCTRYMWSNDMIVLWNHISAIFYEDREFCLHIFLKQHALVH